MMHTPDSSVRDWSTFHLLAILQITSAEAWILARWFSGAYLVGSHCSNVMNAPVCRRVNNRACHVVQM